MATEKPRTVKIAANMLTDGEVDNVSLVKRGANRLPFRITKSDNSENDMPEGVKLDTLFLQKSAPQLTLAGIVVPAHKAEKAVAALKEDGHENVVTESINDNATFVKFAKDATAEGASIIGLQHGAAVVHNAKSFTPFVDSKVFDENLKANSFFPSLWDASEALEDTIRSILYDNDTKEPPIEEINDAIDRYKSHVMGVVNALPTTLFKMDNLHKALSESDGEENAGDGSAADDGAATKSENSEADAGAEDDPDDSGEAEDEDGDGDEADAEGAGDHETGADDDGAESQDKSESDGKRGKQAKSDDADAGGKQAGTGKSARSKTEEANAAFDRLTEMVGNLQKSMEARFTKMDESLKSVRETAEAAQTTAKSADEAVRGTVNGSADDDRSVNRGKQEGNGRTFEDGLYGNNPGGDGDQVRAEIW